MISVHLDGLRRADVSSDPSGARVTLRVGAYDRVCLIMKTETQARIIAEAVNAAVDPDAPVLDKRPARGSGASINR